MKRILPLLLFVLSTIQAQVGEEQIYNFLNLTGSAKQAALGVETLTLIDDINQPLWNLAGINEDMNHQLSVNYMNYLADINLLSATFAHKMNEKLGTFHTGITYLNYAFSKYHPASNASTFS
jgi:hypothetical protein